MEEGEGQQASQPVHSTAVGLVSFSRPDGRRETLVEVGNLLGQTTRGREDSLAKPPEAEKTSGVKEACSTSRIRCSYARFFVFSCIR